jgi:hypothetical protein
MPVPAIKSLEHVWNAESFHANFSVSLRLKRWSQVLGFWMFGVT